MFILISFTYFALFNIVLTAQICPPRHRMSTLNKCEPICDNGCENGTCRGPNVCECNEEYEKSVEKKCVPVCFDGCVNGECIAPRKCICKEGYILSNGVCQSICGDNCQHGFCVGPGKCKCNVGYSKSPEDNCEPICEGGCPNGFCAEPGECKCNAGFTQIETTKECVTGDRSSIKSSKETTKSYSKSGAEDYNSTEEPLASDDCTQNCNYGTCVNNICQCVDGFKWSKSSLKCLELSVLSAGESTVTSTGETTESISESAGQEHSNSEEHSTPDDCAQNCNYGTCVNNICQCVDGFKWSKSTLKCLESSVKSADESTIKSTTESISESDEQDYSNSEEHFATDDCEQNCNNGTCINNSCKCDDGFELSAHSSLICVKYSVNRDHEKLTNSKFNFLWILAAILLPIVCVIMYIVYRFTYMRTYNIDKKEKQFRERYIGKAKAFSIKIPCLST